MAKPQQPELHRSGKGATDPNSTKTSVEVQPGLGAEGEAGPVPEDNLPGHHPAHDQDKPDPDAFVARFSGADRAEGEDGRDGGDEAAATAQEEQRQEREEQEQQGTRVSSAGRAGVAQAASRPAAGTAHAARTVSAEADLDQPGGLSGLLANAPRPVAAAAGFLFLPWVPSYLIAREIYRRLTAPR